MNADLHMAEDLRSNGKGNLFVIFGEPDIEIEKAEAGQIRVRVKGVDVFRPNTGEIVSDDTDGIACWFIDTDYNEESFFVRHAYFLGANNPYDALKISLKAEINDAQYRHAIACRWVMQHGVAHGKFQSNQESARTLVRAVRRLGSPSQRRLPPLR